MNEAEVECLDRRGGRARRGAGTPPRSRHGIGGLFGTFRYVMTERVGGAGIFRKP